MTPASQPKGSRHRPRAMIALSPAMHEVLADYAREKRQPARWALHDLLLRLFVQDGRISQARADEIWADLTSRSAGDE